mgnify:CR=1 FL=1
MSTDIDSIKRKLLIKYPVFGSVIANLEIQANKDIATAGTDGKVLLYNPKFLDGLSEKQQIFIFAHEICHVAFEHIFRSEGKDKRLWNIATDSVINALLKQDGLPIVEGGVDIPEAINYDAEEMYNQLLEEEKKKQEQQNSQRSQEENDIGHDTHSLWDKVTEERKKEQKETEEKSKFAEQGEIETFKQNKIERIKQLQKLSRELANEASHEAGTGIQRQGKKLSDIGIATPLIDWRKLLRQAVKYDEEWTRKNARMRNGYFRHKVEEIPIPETEILLDTSGSVSETLLRNFLRECKNILANSKVKVGCFNTEFHGFTELKKIEDIDNMSFPIGGGTDFNAAVEAFSRRVPNKIIFTDGEAPMPEKSLRNVIWVVFGNQQINPRGGKVININGEQLRKLYCDMQKDNQANISR